MERHASPVVILGAGINGCALARELALNGVPVWVVDSADVAFGATSKSSRLIHGGLRYLEYGEFRLVRESLEERDRLRSLAPQFVEPLRLFIPVSSRFSGVATSALRFLGASKIGLLNRMANALRGERGLWLARIGLKMYDGFGAHADFPPHSVHSRSEAGVPQIDRRFPWLLAYSDGQMRYPERFVLALLEDARRTAEMKGLNFRVLTHSGATLDDDGLMTIRRSAAAERIAPRLVVNASGAWGDFTLEQLRVPSPPLFGGTKGSHILTWNERLVRALGGNALYAEAEDGRLVFVLPFGQSAYVGTTDERFADRPERAVASREEINYLVDLVNELFPDVGLTRDDVAFHCCGVRPLPYVPEGSTASISRDHAIAEHVARGVTILTLVGGKLTTCRAFAEQTANRIFDLLGVRRVEDTRTRAVPGGEDYPPDASAFRAEIDRLADAHRLHVWQVAWLWQLLGTRVRTALDEMHGELHDASGEAVCLDGTPIPLAVVDWMIEHEWAETVGDLAERRLMLVYDRELSGATLRHLADRLAARGKLPRDRIESAVAEAIDRLRAHYGRTID